MGSTPNGSSALQHFERCNALEIRNRIMFDFYPGLPHIQVVSQKSAHPLLLVQFPVYGIGTKFTLMSTHPGSSFTCAPWGGRGRVGGGGGGVRSTASSAMHIGGKELCVTFLNVITQWLFEEGCC